MGGASTRVSNAIKGLRSRGHRVFVVTALPHYPHGNVPREYRTRAFAVEGDEQVRVFRVWVPPLPHEGAKRLVMYLSFTLFSLVALPFCGKVDVVWALSPNYFSAVSGVFYKMAKRVPLVLDIADLWPEALVSLGVLRSRLLVGLVNAGAGFFYAVSDGIITMNEGMRREILKRVKDPSRVSVVENVADLDVFRPFEVERPPSLRGKFVAMYSGNLGRMYDFDTVLESARELSSFADILFVIRGSGERLLELRRKVRDYGNVLLLDEVVDVKRVSEFLNMADVLLLPMKRLENPETSYPIKLVEYLGCEKPVICCAEGETASLISRSDAGLVVEPERSKDLSDAILKLHTQRDLGEKLGKSGRLLVIENLSPQRIAEKLEEYLSSLVSRLS
jgi:glycosyltransferase involved in cell wall biosynthesis